MRFLLLFTLILAALPAHAQVPPRTLTSIPAGVVYQGFTSVQSYNQHIARANACVQAGNRAARFAWLGGLTLVGAAALASTLTYDDGDLGTSLFPEWGDNGGGYLTPPIIGGALFGIVTLSSLPGDRQKAAQCETEALAKAAQLFPGRQRR